MLLEACYKRTGALSEVGKQVATGVEQFERIASPQMPPLKNVVALVL